jgi:glycosyltransferase involved in cell wall biosynthesis
MKTLYIITLEQIEQRYTAQWYKYFKKEFGKNFNVKYIDGLDMPDKIENGKFLDINGTNMWKGYQIYEMATLFAENKIKEGDRFFFADGWHPGATSLKYMIQLNEFKNVKMFGYLHAGSWDPYDFISQKGLSLWASNNELGWIKAFDNVFVATKFHKKLIENYFINVIKQGKIKVVGFPMDWDKEIKKHIKNKNVKKENIIVFPHRIDKEKQPKVFDELAKIMPKYKFIKTLEVTKNKKEYYKLLQKAKVVFSANLQETFGIGTVEAMCLGCVPVVPNRLSYKELYNRQFKYVDINDAVIKIYTAINSYDNKYYNRILNNNINKIKQQSLESVEKMSEVMNK